MFRAMTVQPELPPTDRFGLASGIHLNLRFFQRSGQAQTASLQIRLLQDPDSKKVIGLASFRRARQAISLGAGEKMPGDLLDIHCAADVLDVDADVAGAAHQADDQALRVTEVESQPAQPCRAGDRRLAMAIGLE